MAECTPNLRASYEAAETTPRSWRWPPTMTGFPLRLGSNSSSNETKNASMSTWNTVRERDDMARPESLARVAVELAHTLANIRGPKHARKNLCSCHCALISAMIPDRDTTASPDGSRVTMPHRC